MELCDWRSLDDEFLKMSFKVETCMLYHGHSWKMCPFVHPGEPIQRRHPSTHRGDMCPALKKGRMCENGDACTFAHNSHELWLHPSRFKTKMCRSGAACPRGICFFAHSEAELRQKGSTKQGVLNPDVLLADAGGASRTSVWGALDSGVPLAAAPTAATAGTSVSFMTASMTASPSSGSGFADLFAAASGSSSGSSSMSPSCMPDMAGLSLSAESSNVSGSAISSCTPVYDASSNVSGSLPAVGAAAVPAAPVSAAASAAFFGRSTGDVAPPYGSDVVYTQQCIEQMQQEVQQRLAQLENSRMDEQMLAATLQQQQQMGAGAAVTYSNTSALQQQQHQMAAGAAVTYSNTAALQQQQMAAGAAVTYPNSFALPAVSGAAQSATMPVVLTPTGIIYLAQAPSGSAPFEMSASAGVAHAPISQMPAAAAGQLVLPPAQVFNSSSSVGGPYWLLPSGELAMQPPPPPPQLLHQQQQLQFMPQPQQFAAQYWTVAGTGGFVQL